MPLFCKVCLEDAQRESPAQVTKCGHVFCSECITHWFNTESTCPVCRRSHKSDELITIFDECTRSPRVNGSPPSRDTQRTKSEDSASGNPDVVNNMFGHLAQRWQSMLTEQSDLRKKVTALESENESLRAQVQQLKAAAPAHQSPPTLLSDRARGDTHSTSTRSGPSTWDFVKKYTETHHEPIHGIAMRKVPGEPLVVATASWDNTCKLSSLDEQGTERVLRGHEQGLYAVKFSQKSSNILGTVSSDCTCRLWDVESLECRAVLQGHTDEVNGLAFHPWTDMVATASDDLTAILWDTATAKPHSTLKGHNNTVYGVCFQPEGPLVATVSFDWTCKLWDVRQAKNVKSLEGHQDDIIGVDMASTSSLLATGSDDGTCCVWDLRNWAPASVLQGHSGEVKRVVFSPPCTDPNTWELTAGGEYLVTTGGDQTIRVYCMRTFECVSVLGEHTDHVFDAAWSPDCTLLASASHDKTWNLWRKRSTQ